MKEKLPPLGQLLLCPIGEGVHVAGRMRTRGFDPVEPSGLYPDGAAPGYCERRWRVVASFLLVLAVRDLALEHAQSHVRQLAVYVVLELHARIVSHEEDVRVIRPVEHVPLDALELRSISASAVQ